MTLYFLSMLGCILVGIFLRLTKWMDNSGLAGFLAISLIPICNTCMAFGTIVLIVFFALWIGFLKLFEVLGLK